MYSIDTWHDNYDGAPNDGSAWIDHEDEHRRVIRGGSWYNYSPFLRSGFRTFPENFLKVFGRGRQAKTKKLLEIYISKPRAFNLSSGWTRSVFFNDANIEGLVSFHSVQSYPDEINRFVKVIKELISAAGY